MIVKYKVVYIVYSRVFLAQEPRQIISCIDFRYITDALTEEEALGKGGGKFHPVFGCAASKSTASLLHSLSSLSEILMKAQEGKQQRGEHTKGRH